jgi:hypothetical protein
MIIERLACLVVFGIAELCIILWGPKHYLLSLRRARSYGRFPFHAFPRSLNEKYHWRKVFDRNPEFVALSDKLALRDWMKGAGVDVAMTPVLWAGASPHALPREMLSGDVMIKPNHASGVCFPMWEKAHADDEPSRATLIAKLNSVLKSDYSRMYGEWGYKNIPPRVFAEKRIGRDGTAINDLKFYMFGRRIERIVHLQDRPDGRYGQVFEPDGLGGFTCLDRFPSVCIGKAEVSFDKVLGPAAILARNLGDPFDHMRVDLLEADGAMWLTEMTIYNQGGHLPNGGEDPDSQISKAWDIRRSWAIRTRSGGLAKRLYLGLLKRALDRADTTRGLPPA